MKAVAILMVVVLVVAIIGTGYLFLTANVVVTAVGVTATEATAQTAVFEKLKSDLAQGSLIGTAFQTGAALEEAEKYQFYTYTVRLKNNSMLTCDMVEIQVTPREGDILQMGEETAKALAPRGVGDASATVLTTVESTAIRELIITYYVWGIPFTLRTTYG